MPTVETDRIADRIEKLNVPTGRARALKSYCKATFCVIVL